MGYSPSYLVSLVGTGTSSGTTYVADYTLFYSNIVEFGLEIWSTQKNSWGFMSGFQYGGGLYRWDSFYLPLGLTYGITKFTSSSTTVTAEAKSGVGLHFGIGWFLGDNFVIEYIGRSATTELKLTSGSDSETATGVIGSAALNLKYFF